MSKTVETLAAVAGRLGLVRTRGALRPPAVLLAVALVLIAGACSSSAELSEAVVAATPDPTAPAATTVPEVDTEPEPPPTATASPEPTDVPTAAPTPTPAPLVPEHILVVDGPEELVFDWSEQRCQEFNLPDTATNVVRNADGLVQLYIGNLDTFRMVGPELDDLEIDCSEPVLTSDRDPDPSAFNASEWISSTYTEDGKTVYGIIHNEYIGFDHEATFPGICPTRAVFDCIDVTLTLGISTDGGASFEHAEPPDHLIATMPYVFDDHGYPSGVWSPSNIIARDDGYHYMLANVTIYPRFAGDTALGWICAMRTDDLSDPSSWRYWDGNEFAGVFVNPYVIDVGPIEDVETCAPVDTPALGAELVESIVWNDVLERYIAIGGSNDPADPDTIGVFYSTSEDLLDWTPRRLLVDLAIPFDVLAVGPNDRIYTYPTLLDAGSPSPNFDHTDDSFHLYIVRHAGGWGLDRDLVRFPVSVETVLPEPASWTFAADTEGWSADNDVGDLTVEDGALAFRSTGDDPYLSTGSVHINSQFDRATITMAVDGGDNFAQLFFVTGEDSLWGGEKVIGFEVIGDGAMHTYDLDMSTLPEWGGTIVALRIDPVTTADTTIRIDEITVDR